MQQRQTEEGRLQAEIDKFIKKEAEFNLFLEKGRDEWERKQQQELESQVASKIPIQWVSGGDEDFEGEDKNSVSATSMQDEDGEEEGQAFDENKESVSAASVQDEDEGEEAGQAGDEDEDSVSAGSVQDEDAEEEGQVSDEESVSTTSMKNGDDTEEARQASDENKDSVSASSMQDEDDEEEEEGQVSDEDMVDEDEDEDEDDTDEHEETEEERNERVRDNVARVLNAIIDKRKRLEWEKEKLVSNQRKISNSEQGTLCVSRCASFCCTNGRIRCKCSEGVEHNHQQAKTPPMGEGYACYKQGCVCVCVGGGGNSEQGTVYV